MKKTVTINLNNIVFNIDDDAYDMLRSYLADVEKYLSDDEKKEVMADIEARIAEIFTDSLKRNKTVINIDDVDEIINVLGKPNQYADDDETESKSKPNPKPNRNKTQATVATLVNFTVIPKMLYSVALPPDWQPTWAGM
jgi:uncharacterized protein (DUF2267 family)